MAYKISDECIQCGACAPQCPVNCIFDDGKKHCIKPEECIDCGVCASVCPVDAISQ